jgi:hypothetical protein
MNVQLVESIKQLILALPQEEQGWLKSQMVQEDDSCAPGVRNLNQAVVDINSFSGVIQLTQDPMIFQQQIRDEWA